MSEREKLSPSGPGPEDSQLPLFPADILARVKVWPGSEEARQMTVGSGQKCCASSVPSGPLGLLVRTLLATSLWVSPVCLLTWEVRAIGRRDFLYRLVPLVLSIKENGSLLWRTPHANNWKNPSTMEERIGGGHTLNLQDQVRWWPTPTTGDYYTRQTRYAQGGFPLTMAVLWPTPTATERSGNNPVTGRGAGLSKAVKLWPTPRSAEWKGSGPKGSKSQKYRLQKRYLDGTVLEEEPGMSGGKLNPRWVEWLMGFPLGWTDISTAEGLRLSATPSSRSKSTPSSEP